MSRYRVYPVRERCIVTVFPNAIAPGLNGVFYTLMTGRNREGVDLRLMLRVLKKRLPARPRRPHPLAGAK